MSEIDPRRRIAGARLKKARNKAKKKQHEIAAQLGCTQTTVSYWEAGKCWPKTSELKAVAKAYGVKVSELLA